MRHATAAVTGDGAVERLIALPDEPRLLAVSQSGSIAYAVLKDGTIQQPSPCLALVLLVRSSFTHRNKRLDALPHVIRHHRLWGVHDLNSWLDSCARLPVPQARWSCGRPLMSLI